MARHKNSNWELPDSLTSFDQAALAVLMDVRDELQHLNQTLDGANTRSIPTTLREISSRLQKVVEQTCRRRRRRPAERS